MNALTVAYSESIDPRPEDPRSARSTELFGPTGTGVGEVTNVEKRHATTYAAPHAPTTHTRDDAPATDQGAIENRAGSTAQNGG